MNFQTVHSPLFFCKIIRIERLLVRVAIMVSYLLRGKEEKHSTSTILWKNRGLGTIYNQLHTIEIASRVCYLKVMTVQGIMVRIHSIVVRNKKKNWSLSRLGLLPCSLASGLGGSNFKSLRTYILTFISLLFLHSTLENKTEFTFFFQTKVMIKIGLTFRLQSTFTLTWQGSQHNTA